jgi:NAD(P)-dependent dehydrogenase (short-subunit alcohol dehydrogenase family)
MPIVLVTGSSSGFGELTAKTLAQLGHRVYASMRAVDGKNADAAQRLRDWAVTNNAALSVVELDVSSDASVRDAIAWVLKTEGTVDVVINNAGAAAAGPLEAFSIDQMASLLSVNVLGPMRVNKAVLPTMRAQKSGFIIWVTSTLGRVLPGRGGLYPATKWAAEGFAESLRYQVAPFGIDLTIVEPGSFPTPATLKSIQADDADVTAAYASVAPPPNGAQRPADRGLPDPQEVADVIRELIDLPAGQRPLRRVVGPVFTEGVAEYNARYEEVRAHLEQVLRRPDQAITWNRPR